MKSLLIDKLKNAHVTAAELVKQHFFLLLHQLEKKAEKTQKTEKVEKR